MADYTTPSARARGKDRGRVRPRTVAVWKCTLCGTIYDSEPRNPISGEGECPRCQSDTGLIKTRVED